MSKHTGQEPSSAQKQKEGEKKLRNLWFLPNILSNGMNEILVDKYYYYNLGHFI